MNICYCLSMLNWIFGKDMLNRFDKYDQNLSNKVKKIHKLPDKYIFYPAMYLPHKNHKYIKKIQEKII